MTKSHKLICIMTAVAAFLFAVCTAFVAAPRVASANAALPFTLTAPQNVVLTKENIGDSSTTLGMAYSMSNEINAFFVAYYESGDGAAYLASRGITAYDEIFLGIQIDWALDDVNDAVSGWHHNAYWDAAGATGTLGTDEEGKYRYSEWEVVDCSVPNATQTVNDIWLYRFMNIGQWQGDASSVGVRDQLRPSQYTYTEHDGDLEVRIDWTEHTMYSRVRFVVTTYNDETNKTEYTFSDWSTVVAWGKDAAKDEPLTPADVPAPVITGLRLTDETFNDNPVVAFTLTVPEEIASATARAVAKNNTLRIEVEARIKGTTEWKDLHVAADLTTGEHKACLVYLAEQGKIFPAGTEVEMRARYYCAQQGQDDFYSGYSKVIGFGSDDIVYNEAPAVNGGGAAQGGGDGAEGTHKCKICHICPEPLGLCIFIWLAIIAAVAIVVFVVIKVIKKAKEKKDEDKNNE